MQIIPTCLWANHDVNWNLRDYYNEQFANNQNSILWHNSWVATQAICGFKCILSILSGLAGYKLMQDYQKL